MIVLLEWLLALGNQGKWLIAAISLFLSLPVLVPFLLLFFFLASMLLLPALGCALVGFLLWWRLRHCEPAAAAACPPPPIRDEKQEKRALLEGDEESESSNSDTESALSDYEEIMEVYQGKDLEELLCREGCPDIDFGVESINDNTTTLGRLDDDNRGAGLTSIDVADMEPALYDEQDYLVNADIHSALSNEQEEMWLQEMQLELEKHEMLHTHDTDDRCIDWIDWIEMDESRDDRHLDWISASDASHDAKNHGAKRSGKTSSIASLLSTGSGSISMTSTVSSTSSSSSTAWSAWSEESRTNLHDSGPLKKGSHDGRKGSAAFSGRTGVVGNGGQGKRMGISAANRGKIGGIESARALARTVSAHVDGGGGCVKVSKLGEVGADQMNRQGRRSVWNGGPAYSIGRAGEAGTHSQVSAANRVRVARGGRRVVAEEEVKHRISAIQDESVDNNHYYIKKGNNINSNNTARRSGKAPWLGGGGAQQAAAAAAAVRGKPTCTTDARQIRAARRNVSSVQVHVGSKTAGHVSRVRGGEATSGTGGRATSEVEDVGKRMVHVKSMKKEGASAPPYAHIHARDEYAQFYQLLEFWRGIERAFLQVTTNSPPTSR